MKTAIFVLMLGSLLCIDSVAAPHDRLRKVQPPKTVSVGNLSTLLIGTTGLSTNKKFEEAVSTLMQPHFFRKIGESKYDLRPLAAKQLVGFDGTIPPELEGWHVLEGKVISVIDEGVLFENRVYVAPRFNNNYSLKYFFVLGEIPNQPIDGKYYKNLLAKQNGVYQYNSVGDGWKTVPRFDIGTIDTDAFNAAVNQLVLGIEEILEQEKKLEAARLSAADAKALEFQIKRAESGSASAQYDLALRYLEGKGLEQDELKAIDLLRKSAAQDYSPAKKKLEELEKNK